MLWGLLVVNLAIGIVFFGLGYFVSLALRGRSGPVKSLPPALSFAALVLLVIAPIAFSLIFFTLGGFWLGYFVSSVLRTRSALPALVLLAGSVIAFVLLNVSFYNGLRIADETGTAGGADGPGTGVSLLLPGLLFVGLGIASLTVHLRARSSGN